MVETSYFLFTICWNLFRAFDTTTSDFRNLVAGKRKAEEESNNSKD